jgi:hypothetical protein
MLYGPHPPVLAWGDHSDWNTNASSREVAISETDPAEVHARSFSDNGVFAPHNRDARIEDSFLAFGQSWNTSTTSAYFFQEIAGWSQRVDHREGRATGGSCFYL